MPTKVILGDVALFSERCWFLLDAVIPSTTVLTLFQGGTAFKAVPTARDVPDTSIFSSHLFLHHVDYDRVNPAKS